MDNGFKHRLFVIMLLVVLFGNTSPAWAISELTLRVTDFVSVISARATANSIDEASRKQFRQGLSNMETELKHHEAEDNASLFSSINYPEMHLLLKIVWEVLDDENNLSGNQRDMLLQQAELIMKKNKGIDFNGEDSLRSYYLFTKTIGVNETYRLLSNNAHFKLPMKSFRAWWDNSVKNVSVKKVTNLGRNQYKIWLLYELIDGNQQCSEDWLQLIKGENGWLIDDFYWSQSHISYCESL